MRHLLTTTALCLVISLAALAQRSALPPASGACTDGDRQRSLDKTPACTIFQGQPNAIPLWVNALAIGSSVMYQDPNTKYIGVATNHPSAALDVNGNANVAGNYQIGTVNMLGIGQTSDMDLFVGYQAGVNNVPGMGQRNSFVGFQAGNMNTIGYDNSFIGANSGPANIDGIRNTFVGSSAGMVNQSGNDNVFVGAYVGQSNLTGFGNTFVGSRSGSRSGSGNANTFYGYEAGYNNSSGGSNTFIGYQAGFSNTSGSSNVYIANQGPGTESNTIRIGDQNQMSTYISGIFGVNNGGVPVMINSSGQLGAPSSSLRFKDDVRDMGDSSAALMNLRPVTFMYKPEYDSGSRLLQYGLIAEEVAKIYPELVAYDNDGQPYSVRYQYLSVMLLNEAQKQYRRAEAQAKVISAQQERIELLEQRLSRLEAKFQGKVELASSAR
jgi:hypothetical protein